MDGGACSLCLLPPSFSVARSSSRSLHSFSSRKSTRMQTRESKRKLNNSSGMPNTNNTLDLVDRISELPDSILGLILSNLPTKNAVATAILSKRWKFVWINVHNLDFSLLNWTTVLPEDKNMKFVQFVNSVLLSLDGGLLNKFSLEWDRGFIPSQVSTWVNTAITRNLHELYLLLWNCYDSDEEDFEIQSESLEMPVRVFNSDSLQSLELNGCISVSAAIAVCLPRLESLILVSVYFHSEEDFEKLICGCPMLNYLHLRMNNEYMSNYSEGNDDFTYKISSTSLRHLKLCIGYSECDSTPSLQLEASSLEYLKLCGRISQVSVQGCLSSLLEADFRIEFWDSELSEDTCNSVVEAVRAFDCAKALTLSVDVMWALSNATICLSTKFTRLTKLEVGSIAGYCRSLQDFIQSSDSLEVLTISQDLGDLEAYYDDHLKWTAPIEVPRCLSYSLKEVAFKCYGGYYDDEREMLRYMLKHGNALEVMQVTCVRSNEKEENLELVKEIGRFPIKSPVCKVKCIA